MYDELPMQFRYISSIDASHLKKMIAEVNSSTVLLNYTPPQKSGQDFAPSQVENVNMRRFY
jgi:hypothetical protein